MVGGTTLYPCETWSRSAIEGKKRKEKYILLNFECVSIMRSDIVSDLCELPVKVDSFVDHVQI